MNINPKSLIIVGILSVYAIPKIVKYFNKKLKKKNKKKALIYDNIHGYIQIDPIATKIIDTPVFQRLRYIHQTGCLYLVFPTATHTRFEHSIGTYYLARKFIISLKNNQPELNINERLVLLVSIAGLCHDLGHLIYSHLFDDLFLSRLSNYKELGEMVHHEARSILLLKYLVKKYKIDLSDNEINIISDLINPKKNDYDNWPNKFKVGEWIFQIVSNPINNIDVDKFDYICRDNNAVGSELNFDYSRLLLEARVYNNNIYYPKQVSNDIYHMFFIRYRLHRQIYNHKTVKAIEIMILNCLFELEKTNKISGYINNPEKMIKLTDMYLHFTNNENVNHIIEKIHLRNFPSLIFEKISLQPYDINDKLLNNVPFSKDKFSIMKFKVGYCSGKEKNPLKNIKFYNTKTKKILNIDYDNNFSLLINKNHQEYFYRIYCLDKSILEVIKNYFN